MTTRARGERGGCRALGMALLVGGGPAWLGFVCPAPSARPGASESGGSPEGGVQVSAPSTDSLALSLSVQEPSPRAGQPLTFVLEANNRGDTELELDFRDAQRYDFEVFAGATSTWRWSADKFFAQMIGREVVPPGGTARWSARLEEGLPAGTYRVVATLTSADPATAELMLQVGS